MTTVSRANVEAILVKRTGPLLTRVGMAVTFAGANADLNDPIGWGLRQAGYTVADISVVTDADLVGLATADTDKFLDLAELRVLQTISGNWAGVDTQLGPRSESLNQFRIAIEERIDRKQKQIEQLYGIGTPTLEAGLLTIEFAEHTEE